MVKGEGLGIYLNQTKMRKTKIVCTLGPATDNDKVLEDLILNGMNVARCNFSHSTYEQHKTRMDKIKEIRKKCDKPVAILLDTKDRRFVQETLRMVLSMCQQDKPLLWCRIKIILETMKRQG